MALPSGITSSNGLRSDMTPSDGLRSDMTPSDGLRSAVYQPSTFLMQATNSPAIA